MLKQCRMPWPKVIDLVVVYYDICRNSYFRVKIWDHSLWQLLCWSAVDRQLELATHDSILTVSPTKTESVRSFAFIMNYLISF